MASQFICTGTADALKQQRIYYANAACHTNEPLDMPFRCLKIGTTDMHLSHIQVTLAANASLWLGAVSHTAFFPLLLLEDLSHHRKVLVVGIWALEPGMGAVNREEINNQIENGNSRKHHPGKIECFASDWI